jgi:twinfilin-like protein
MTSCKVNTTAHELFLLQWNTPHLVDTHHVDISQANLPPVLSPAVREAFASFLANSSLLALPLVLTEKILQPLRPVYSKDSSASFQTSLNELLTILKPRTPLYLILRRNDSLVAITFAPYLAKDTHRAFFLDNRHSLVQQLGAEHFSQSLICKEIGEITDARSWTERDSNTSSDTNACKDPACTSCTVQDIGYKRNKCRLCDRRMQNPIAPDALSALSTLSNPGALVQIVRLPLPLFFTY